VSQPAVYVVGARRSIVRVRAIDGLGNNVLNGETRFD
jgi:hypothetical protein